MNSRQIFVMASALAIGLAPMAMAKDCTNKYFSTPMTTGTVEVTTSSPVVIEKSCSSPVVIEKSCSSPVVIEKTLSAPVVVEKTGTPPAVIEDRIVKQKHAFGLGIWPLFDFELM
jgi:hypothetical protein